MSAILVIAAVAAGLAAPPAAAALVTAQAPPGWTDLSGGQSQPDILVALKGPETSSFVLTRVVAPLPLDNRGAMRAYLLDALSALNRRTGLAFRPATNVTAATFDNGLSVQYIRADLNGKPRLIMAAGQLAGVPLLGVLSSAVPETMLPEILRGLRCSAPPPAAARLVETEDGQIAVPLPDGVSSRALTERERRQEAVLALAGWGSDAVLFKAADQSPIEQRAPAVRAAAAQTSGADPATLALLRATTVAGPQLIYAVARVNADGKTSEAVVGYLPWCYWGYSLQAKGPQAADLLAQSLAGARLGSSAMPKLVAETPRVPTDQSWRMTKRQLKLGAGAGALLLLLLLRLLRRPRRA